MSEILPQLEAAIAGRYHFERELGRGGMERGGEPRTHRGEQSATARIKGLTIGVGVGDEGLGEQCL